MVQVHYPLVVYWVEGTIDHFYNSRQLGIIELEYFQKNKGKM